MAKEQPIWVCTDCGNETLKWGGRCPSCGAWNSLKEVRLPAASRRSKNSNDPIEIFSLETPEAVVLPDRLLTGTDEVDRVLGGGFFPGTVALVAGEPGIGKSTLLLHVAHAVTHHSSVIYASGEESGQQIQQRAGRLGLIPSTMKIVTSTELPALLDLFEKDQPKFVIIDSIQTLVDPQYPSAAGSVVQVRECALALQRWAKRTGATLLLVGHVTKEGVVAGPRTLEHLVDVVISLDGERTGDLRLLHCIKNRFGPTDEVGIVAMTSDGLLPVDNPSARFLEHRAVNVAGSVTTVILEGSRPILVEIQALTRPTSSPYPRRTASGFDLGRLELILAVLEARAGIRLGNLDCYVNVSGGLRLREPAADLAVALAIASSATGRILDEKLVAFGEIGLAGELRPVVQATRRIDEAKRLGFTNLVTARTLAEVLAECGIRPTGRSKEKDT